MERAAVLVFGACAATAVWTLAGYPAVLALLPRREWARIDATPSVSIVIPAYRERAELPAKLASVRALDYPDGLIEVIVVVDGDPELARIAAAADPGARVLTLEQRSGKPAALNLGLAHAQGEIVVLTDAGDPLAPAAVRAAVRHFGSAAVGAVAGRAHRASPYDRYEAMVRRLEARSGSVAALSGAFVAARRVDLPRFPEEVVNDDLWLLMQFARSGRRVVYEPAAAALEPSVSAAGEYERRARMAAGRAMLIGGMRGLPARFAWRLASHKLARLLLPFALAGALISATALALSGAGAAWTIVALAGLALFAAGGAAALTGAGGGPGHALAQLAAGNLSVARGVGRATRRRQSAIWRDVR
jgi:hypothetical protein